MKVYYWVLFATIILSYLAQHSEKTIILEDGLPAITKTRASGFFFFLVAVLLFLVAGLRYNVGTDFGAYYRHYLQYSADLWDRIKTLSEPGYSVLARLAVLLGGGGTMAVFLASLTTVGLNFRTIYKHTDKLLYASLLYLFLGCWHGEFNAVRQCLAGAFVFFGYGFLRNKRFWPYALCVFLAFLCHRSSALMIIPFFLLRREINIGNTLLLFLGAIALVVSEQFVFSSTSALMDTALDENSVYLTTAVNIFRTLVGVSPAVFFYALFWNREKTADDTFCLNLLLFHAAVSIATMNSAYYARYTIYTAPFLTIAIPELSKKISKRNRGIISFFILALYFVFWIYELSNSSSLNNFHFVWEQ